MDTLIKRAPLPIYLRGMALIEMETMRAKVLRAQAHLRDAATTAVLMLGDDLEPEAQALIDGLGDLLKDTLGDAVKCIDSEQADRIDAAERRHVRGLTVGAGRTVL